MFSFESKVIDATVEKLINGKDYRQEIVNDINIKFLDFTLEFFKKIVEVKLNDNKLTLPRVKTQGFLIQRAQPLSLATMF